MAEAFPARPAWRAVRVEEPAGQPVFFLRDAYLNEQGISNRFAPTDVTTVCKTRWPILKTTANDIDAFAPSCAPPRHRHGTQRLPIRPTVGLALPCLTLSAATSATCKHSPRSRLGPAINGGAFIVPAALGNKTFHPFSDFLLHNVGTGDGIVQNGGQATANKLRTPPLWGLRTHLP